MEHSQDDRFVVWLRNDCSRSYRPDLAEHLLATCFSYADARRIQREFRYTARDCVIRYVGPVGGGD